MWHRLDQELAARRDRHHLPGTWADLARALETSEQRINNWKRRGVPPAQYAAIATVLGWSVDRLIGVADKASSGKSHVDADQVVDAEVQRIATVYANLSPTERRRFLHLLAAARDDAPVLGDDWEQAWTSRNTERVIDETKAHPSRERVIDEMAPRAPSKKRRFG